MRLISAFSDNEGIIFVTRNHYSTDIGKTTTIRFHRIYQNNWFFLGRYNLRRQNQAIDFTGVFMFQGQFFLYEDIKNNVSSRPFDRCSDVTTSPPKISLLDRMTDEFVEQILIINNQDFDYFGIRL